jgi:pimeloyl-ACP methyl ester carboxylesterase
MLYWVTETITSSTRLYWERQHTRESPLGFIDVPTAVARYPMEPIRFPRSWVERCYRVTRWVDMPRGGHFAAMEQPDLFVDEVRTFFIAAT